MMRRAKTFGQRIVLGVLLGALGLLTWGTGAWASTRLAPDIEIQAWYRMRHTFQTDTDHFEWVQWRNEGFVWLTYDNFYKNGKLFDRLSLPLPLVESASLSARWRSRVDPIYEIREHYRNLYKQSQTDRFMVPENGFRDLYADVDHGYIGPGKLFTRWGYQQVVWGESDLFRSIDIVNPLRIDQNFGVGEKFDEFRSPILALKALYDIGNIGTSISGAGLEAFYTPRFRTGTDKLLLHNGWRTHFNMRSCEDPNNPGREIDYTADNCANSRRFLPMRPTWLGKRRSTGPWDLNVVGANARSDSVDYACVTSRCAPDVPGDRQSLIVTVPKGDYHHHSRGSDWHAAGVRFTGSTWFNLDFSLNFMYLPSSSFANTNPNDATGETTDLPTYTDDLTDPDRDGSFREGLLACLSQSGQGGANARNVRAILKGGDLLGYNWSSRRLNADGTPASNADHRHATRDADTVCTNGFSHQRRYTRVIGFTATYNDFDYTGAVFRLEQSYSTKEALNKKALGYANNFAGNEFVNPGSFGNADDRSRKNGRILNSGAVWRSMFGFDLIQALMNYPGMGWTRHLPGQFGVQQSFLTGQWLMQYNATGRSGMTNNMCNWNFAMGTGASLPAYTDDDGERVESEFNEANPNDPLAPKRDAIRGCNTKRWNHLFTLAFAGNGYFRGKLEQRIAYAIEPRGQQHLFFGQWWWREFMSLPVDLSMGTAWFVGSRMQNSWSLLNYFASRDLLWFEATYYIL